MYMYIYIYISYSLKNFYTCTYAHIYNIYIYSCANLHVQSFWSTCMHFSLITMAGKKIETWSNFTEIPVLVNQATRHLYSRT